MSATKILASAAILASATVVGVGCAAPAGASEEWGINGTFATSANGQLAKTNEAFHEQPSIRSTWTISTQCVGPTECTGTVNSDEGWTAPIYTTSGLWFVKRTVPQWRFCVDGTPIEGLQTYKIYPVGFNGTLDLDAHEYTGEQQTVGPSGSCGRNQWPTVRMPFYMRPA